MVHGSPLFPPDQSFQCFLCCHHLHCHHHLIQRCIHCQPHYWNLTNIKNSKSNKCEILLIYVVFSGSSPYFLSHPKINELA